MGRRYVLSKRERRQLVKEISNLYPGFTIERDVLMEIYEDREIGRILLIDGVPAFFTYGDKWFPHLKYLLKQLVKGVPVIVVDMGAVKPLLRGADLMAPGIVEIRGEFHEGDPVVVVEEKYGKPFMVGAALIDSKPLLEGSVKRGRVVKNIHRIGDRLWRMFG